MAYKYKKNQLFGKKLQVPKYILFKVYNCSLSFKEFFEYALYDKIPISCIKEEDRVIVEKFGIDNLKVLDWDLINSYKFSNNFNINELLLSIDNPNDNLNLNIYELVKDEMEPRFYSPKMRQAYPDRLFEILEEDNSNMKRVKEDFNSGETSLKKIVSDWDFYSGKDLSFCLLNDKRNIYSITDSILKNFVSNYGIILDLMVDSIDVYSFINDVVSLNSENEIKKYIKHYTDALLESIYNNQDDENVLTNEQFKKLFEYSSIENFLKLYGERYGENIALELKELSENFIFNMPFPFATLCDSNVLAFLSEFGLKNVVDFDNECGHFFSQENCNALKLMYDSYMHYAEYKQYSTNSRLDSSGSWLGNLYTKEEFYKAMRLMIMEHSSYEKSSNYGSITGEFREKNADLFISRDAPYELQNLFYTKSITPKVLNEHQEFIPYIEASQFPICFQNRSVYVTNGKNFDDCVLMNLYKFLNTIASSDEVINFIIEYSDILEIILYSKRQTQSFLYFSNDSCLEDVKKFLNDYIANLIIEKGISYPKNIPSDFIKSYSSLFLSEEAPKELQEAVYNRTINTEFILSNPEYKSYLKDINLEVLYNNMPVRYGDDRKNLISIMQDTFGKDCFDLMISYGKYIEKVYELNHFNKFISNEGISKEQLLDAIDAEILKAINSGAIKYDVDMPLHFKDNNPNLFLNANIGKELQDKFYKREFTKDDFEKDPNLIDLFDNTNIVYAFPQKYVWIASLYNELGSMKQSNLKRLKIALAYADINDDSLEEAFKEFVLECNGDVADEKIKDISNVLQRLKRSNSTEMRNFKNQLASQILKTKSPLESLDKIEDKFIKNNIPTVGKIYSCFEILHPDFEGFDFENSTISPILKNSSTRAKKFIVFSDLIKASFGSNNRSVNSYLKNIEFGSKLYESLKNGLKQYDTLTPEDKNELIIFSKHLATLYNSTLNGRKQIGMYSLTDDVLKNIFELSKRLSPDGTYDYDLGNRVIKMFCGFAGIETLEQAKEYINSKVSDANKRNRKAANKDVSVETGDLVKGIGDITYLRNILQNGSVAKEFLGPSATSDSTPLDTDLGIIKRSDTLCNAIDHSVASTYGPIWLVLKNNDRFITTRNENETLDVKKDLSKIELFYTGVLGSSEHYGIRTGFASSDIDYIVCENYDPRVGLEIAMNGFYIPVASKDGKIVFTPKDYDDLREKMSGLSYYDEFDYKFSDNLVTPEIEKIASELEQSSIEINYKEDRINTIIKKSLEELGLHLKTSINGDLTEGYVELIDTGSTGRGTNKPGDGDFDFMMRLDNNIISDNSRLNELKQVLLKNFGKENSSELTGEGDFRLKNVLIDGEMYADIDITFTEKTDKVTYSTDMALQDRLSTIKRNDREKYNYVVANILLAKQVLKSYQAYKPNRGEMPQGGLGGVGIENWILQNGGSFYDAAKDFLKCAEGKSFTEFKNVYKIWDFGDNHLAIRKGNYPHDNFVVNNMNEDGYNKMVQCLKQYLNQEEQIIEENNILQI